MFLILWIPAALYSGCLWLLFFAFGFGRPAGGALEKQLAAVDLA